MHDNLTLTQIQGQGHGGLKVAKNAGFKILKPAFFTTFRQSTLAPRPVSGNYRPISVRGPCLRVRNNIRPPFTSLSHSSRAAAIDNR